MTQNSKAKEANNTREKFNNSKELVDVISNALLEKKAEDIVLLDMTELTTLTDYFIICHGGSDTQIKAISSNVTGKTTEDLGERVWRKEGLDSKRWVVLDYVNVVVHIFDKESREYFGLERMWNDAKITSIKDN